MAARTAIERFAFGRSASEATPWVIPRPNTILLGRILLGAIFLVSGVAKLTDWSGSLGYLASKVPEGTAAPLLFIAAIAEIAGALSLITGTLARVGSLGLFLYLIPTTLLFHNFWALEGMEAQMQMVNFMKNLSIMGGLLLVAGFGAGPLSVDSRIRRPN